MDNLEYFTSYVMIIMLILLAIPLIPYLIAIYLDRKGGSGEGSSSSSGSSDDTDNNEHLIENYDEKSKPLVIFNTQNEIYLFCTYILFRRVKICDDNDEDIKNYNKHLSEVYTTAELIKRNLKETIAEIERLKKSATERIIQNRKEREDKEHTDYIENMKEFNANARHSSDNFRKWFIIFFSNIKAFFVVVGEVIAFAVRIVVEIGRLIMPAIAALLRNPVFVGFLILVVLIYYILGLIKESIEKADREKAAAAKSDDTEDTKDTSDTSYSSIFKDFIDTFKYFLNMLNNFKMSSAGLFGSDTGANEAGQIDRDTIAGKSYDNLSYLMLSDVFNGNEFKNYFGISTELESEKYYNVLLPEKRFEAAADMAKFRGNWKVVNRKNISGSDEKVWRLDCSKIDKVIKKDKDGNTIANGFITAFVEDGDKCSINDKALDDYENSLKPVVESTGIDLSTIRIRD